MLRRVTRFGAPHFLLLVLLVALLANGLPGTPPAGPGMKPAGAVLHPRDLSSGIGTAPPIGGLERRAIARFMAIHDAPNDPRITRFGDDEIRALMFGELLTIAKKPVNEVTPEEQPIYDWFSGLVHDYEVHVAEGARAEYKRWQTQGCDFVPPKGFDYDRGSSCDRTLATTLSPGPRVPTFEQFVAWGTGRATGDLPSPPGATGRLLNIETAGLVELSLAAIAGVSGGFAAAAVGSAIFSIEAVSALIWPKLGFVIYLALDRLTATAEELTSLVAGAGGAAIGVAIAFVVLSIVISSIELDRQLKLPDQLAQYVDSVRAKPASLYAYANNNYGGDSGIAAHVGPTLLYALFATQVVPFASHDPIRGAPVFKGDRFQLTKTDNRGKQLADPVLAATIDLQSWGDRADVKVAYDDGWFDVVGPDSYTPATEFNYIDRAGLKRTAHVYKNGMFMRHLGAPAGDNSQAADCDALNCVVVNTINARAPDGSFYTLGLHKNTAPKAEIEAFVPNVIAEGSTQKLTALGNPLGRDQDGDPVTFAWTVDSACPNLPATSGGYSAKGVGRIEQGVNLANAASQLVPENFPGALHCLSSQGGPVIPGGPDPRSITSSARSLDVVWPDDGTYVARLVVTDSHGKSSSAFQEFKVVNTAPTLHIASSDLKSEAVSIHGCIEDAGAHYELPSLSVDWGDGTPSSLAYPPDLFGYAGGTYEARRPSGSGGASDLSLETPPPAQTLIYKSNENLPRIIGESGLVNTSGPTVEYVRIDQGITMSFDELPGCNGSYSFALTHNYTSTPPPGSSVFPVTITADDHDGGLATEVLSASGRPIQVTVEQTPEQADPTSGSKAFASGAVISSPVSFTATFSEAITGLDPKDVVVTGSAGHLEPTILFSSRAAYMARIFVPVTSSGTVTVSLPAGAARSGGGRPTAASTSTDNTVTIDKTPPLVGVIRAGDAMYSSIPGGVAKFVVLFSEPVRWVGEPLVVGTATFGTPSIDKPPGLHDTFDVSVPVSADGSVSLTVPAGAVVDAVGNPNERFGVTSRNTTYIDNVGPVVTVSPSPGQALLVDADTVSFDVSFSEFYDGLDAADFLVSGTAAHGDPVLKNIGSFNPLSQTSPLVRVTVPVQSDGTITLDMANDAVHDQAGNRSGTAGFTTRTITVDRTPPAAVVSQASGQPDPATKSPVVFSVTFTEPVTGFDASDVILYGTAKHGAPVVSGTGPDYVVNVPVTTGGTVTMALADGAAHDALDHASLAVAHDATITVKFPSPLKITAHDKQREYGAADPTFTATYFGFVDGDDPDHVLSRTLACETSATSASPVGGYPITCSGEKAAGYTITYAPGTLTITKATTKVEVEPFAVNVGRAGITLGTMRGHLTRAGTGVGDQVLAFSTGNTQLCSAKTDATGSASCSPGAGAISALVNGSVTGTFGGTSNLRAASGKAGPIG